MFQREILLIAPKDRVHSLNICKRDLGIPTIVSISGTKLRLLDSDIDRKTSDTRQLDIHSTWKYLIDVEGLCF